MMICVLHRFLICQILQRSGICPSRWELKQRKGNRCLSRDTKKLKAKRVKVSIWLNFIYFYCFIHVTVSIFKVIFSNRPDSTMPLLYPLLLSHYCGILPCQDGAIFPHLPGATGESNNRNLTKYYLHVGKSRLCYWHVCKSGLD